MKNEKGFSLVELIIVIALMGIILGFATVGIGTLTNQRGKTVSKDIYNMIGSAKTVAMSKENCYLVLTKDSVSVVYKNTSTGTWVTLQEASINKNVSVYYDGTLINDEHPGIVISFDRSTGGFNGFYEYNTSCVDGSSYSSISLWNSQIYTGVSVISVGSGEREIKIKLYQTTGKYEIQY